jgi:hypothetical protein
VLALNHAPSNVIGAGSGIICLLDFIIFHFVIPFLSFSEFVGFKMPTLNEYQRIRLDMGERPTRTVTPLVPPMFLQPEALTMQQNPIYHDYVPERELDVIAEEPPEEHLFQDTPRIEEVIPNQANESKELDNHNGEHERRLNVLSDNVKIGNSQEFCTSCMANIEAETMNQECFVCLEEGNDKKPWYQLNTCQYGGHPECIYEWLSKRPHREWACEFCQTPVLASWTVQE